MTITAQQIWAQHLGVQLITAQHQHLKMPSWAVTGTAKESCSPSAPWHHLQTSVWKHHNSESIPVQVRSYYVQCCSPHLPRAQRMKFCRNSASRSLQHSALSGVYIQSQAHNSHCIIYPWDFARGTAKADNNFFRLIYFFRKCSQLLLLPLNSAERL